MKLFKPRSKLCKLRVRIKIITLSLLLRVRSLRGDRIFVVTMYRWGSTENHSYLLGTFRSLDHAIDQANNEIESRGGKYEAVVYNTKLDETSEEPVNKIIEWTSLPDSHMCSHNCSEPECSCTLKEIFFNQRKAHIHIA